MTSPRSSTCIAQADAAVTLHLVEVDDPARFGCVPTDDGGRVTAFLEKTPRPVTNRINAGCYVFRRRVIDSIPAGQVVSVERETFPGLIAAGEPVLGYPDTAYWLDVGTPEAFVRASCDLVLGLLPSPAMPGPCGHASCCPARRSSRAPSARRTVIGAGSVVGAARASTAACCSTARTMGPGAVIERQRVGAGVRVGEGTVLDGAFIGEGAAIAERERARGGHQDLAGTSQLGPRTVRFSTDV